MMLNMSDFVVFEILGRQSVFIQTMELSSE